MANYHQSVSLNGFHQEAFMLTMKISGVLASVDPTTVVGKAVSLDITAANTAKLAADGDIIIGRLAAFEGRVNEGTIVGTVEFKFAGVLPIKTAAVVLVGDTVIGAGNGEVKSAAQKNYDDNWVAEIIGTNAVVVKF